MSDVFCKVCGEPWDVDTFHEYAEEWQHLGETWTDHYRRFQREGCGRTFVAWGVKCEPVEHGRNALVADVYALLGDDIDGAAATLEDFGGWSE